MRQSTEANNLQRSFSKASFQELYEKIWLIIIFGIILRLGLMPFTIHPDIRGHYLGGLLIAKEGQFFGVYDYISRLPRDHILAKLYGDNFLVYSLSLIGPMLCL